MAPWVFRQAEQLSPPPPTPGGFALAVPARKIQPRKSAQSRSMFCVSCFDGRTQRGLDIANRD